MDPSRRHIIDFAERESDEKITTNSHLETSDTEHNEKQDETSGAMQPVSQLRTFFAAHESRLQAIKDACSGARPSAADLELLLTELSANPDEPTWQVRSFFAIHDTNIEAVKVACERAQECTAELLQILEESFVGSGDRGARADIPDSDPIGREI